MNKIEVDIKAIVNSNSNILNNILEYIININTRNNKEIIYSELILDIYNNTKYYITNFFSKIRLIKYRELDLRRERQKLKDDLDILNQAYVSGDCLEIKEEGKNTGGKSNQVELRQIQRLNLKEELDKMLLDSLELEKSLRDNSKLFKQFIELIPNPQHQVIISRMYLDCETSSQIADDYFYSTGTVNQYRNRGISFLVKILRLYIELYIKY